MSSNDTPAYGLWPLVIINAAVFIIFPRLSSQSEQPSGLHAAEQSTTRKEHNDAHTI